MFADAHCHLADPRFDQSRDDVLVRAESAGISYFLQGGVDPNDWRRQLELADHRWGLCFGLHPWFVNDADEDACRNALALLEDLLPKAVALGELGMDKGPRLNKLRLSHQETFMRLQLQMAQRHKKPIVLHVVRAHGPVLQVLRDEGVPFGGMVHGFAGSREVAAQYLRLGLAISVGGALTGQGYRKLKDALPYIPKDKLLVESDAPDGRPQAVPGAYNEPCSLPLTAQAAAQLTGRNAEEILAQSHANLRRIFDLENAT